MRPLFEQIEILSGIQTVYSDCKYILYTYAQPSMVAGLLVLSPLGESPAGAKIDYELEISIAYARPSIFAERSVLIETMK